MRKPPWSRDPELAIEEIVEFVVCNSGGARHVPRPLAWLRRVCREWIDDARARRPDLRQPSDALLDEIITDLAAWEGVAVTERDDYAPVVMAIVKATGIDDIHLPLALMRYAVRLHGIEPADLSDAALDEVIRNVAIEMEMFIDDVDVRPDLPI